VGREGDRRERMKGKKGRQERWKEKAGRKRELLLGTGTETACVFAK
jgi:hypothetical protein